MGGWPWKGCEPMSDHPLDVLRYHVTGAVERGEKQPITEQPAAKLSNGALYLGDNGRTMCKAIKCAGMTAHYSGHDLSGQKVSRVSVADVTEWATYDLGPMTCECGAVTLTTVAGPDGWPLSKAFVDEMAIHSHPRIRHTGSAAHIHEDGAIGHAHPDMDLGVRHPDTHR